MNAHWTKIVLAGWLALLVGGSSVSAQTRILCAGDSITYGYGVSVPYPTRLHNNTGLEVINVGRGGMWASYGYKHIDDWLREYNPTHVLIMFGTNDTNDPYQDYRAAADTVIKTALKVRAYGAIPVVGTIPPKIGSRAYQMPRVESFNNRLRSRAASEGILLADIQAAFGSGSGLFQSDGFHPNDAGMEVIARTFAEKIQHLEIQPTFLSTLDVGAVGQSIAVDGNLDWTATAHAPWIAITSGYSGSGDGAIAFDVDVNTGAARTGTITVAANGLNRTCVVAQAAALLATSPQSFALPSTGAANLQIAVTARLPWTVAANQAWIHLSSGTSGHGNGIVRINVDANAGGARRGTLTFSVGETTRTVAINQWPVSTWNDASPGDFDGNGYAELAVFHPATGNWNLTFSGGPQWLFSFGWSAVVPVPADYDGDGLQDFGVYHPASGIWYILESTTGHSLSVQLGYSATVPLPGDYDGDGVADYAVFLPAEGRWYFICSTAGRYSVQWGWASSVPVPADYDGDGATDVAVYHPASGQWNILPSSFPAIGPIQRQWGWNTTVPVAADYDGDGKADVAVFHRATGTWYIAPSSGGSRTQAFGWSTTTPVAADYDGDGKADIAIYHPASGNWHILKSSTGGILVKNWGWSTAQPTLLYPWIHSWFGLP